MRNQSPLLLLSLLAFTAEASSAATDVICLDELPGEYNIPDDTPGRIKITDLVVTSKGEKAIVATEYTGASNLQASVYLFRSEKYCLAGDLGAAIGFRSNPRIASERYYGIVVESKSGSDKFYRSFKYHSGEYVLSECKIKPAGSKLRRCSEAER